MASAPGGAVVASSAVEESTTTARKRPRSSTVAEIEAPLPNVYLELEATRRAAAAAAATLKAFADRVHDLDPGFVAQLPTAHLPVYAQHLRLAKPGYLEATGEIKNKVTFGAEQQHLLCSLSHFSKGWKEHVTWRNHVRERPFFCRRAPAASKRSMYGRLTDAETRTVLRIGKFCSDVSSFLLTKRL